MAGLGGRVSRLEERSRAAARPVPSRTQQEIRAIDAEIRELEREMRADGVDPYRDATRASWAAWRNSAGHPTLPLDEHIAMLEAEIERCPED
jgi:hypothetical protein